MKTFDFIFSLRLKAFAFFKKRKVLHLNIFNEITRVN